MLFDQEKMTGRGKGKYMYRKELREDGTMFIEEMMRKYLPNSKIEYIV
jgi:spore photoproduct lyase